MKKTIISVLAALSLLSSVSCSDEWLTLSDPNRESADTFWQTKEQFEQGLYASYSVWRRPGMFSRWFHVLMILRSDEGWSESPDPKFQAYGNFIISPYNVESTEGIVSPWSETMNQLFYVNQVIDNMNNRGYSLMTKEEADKIMGQAYFIRAVDYWYMAGTFGKMPRQITTLADGEVIEQEEMYRQALSDFDNASRLLPEEWPSADKGRPTVGAALGMMARCNMQLAGICKRPWENRLSEAEAFWQAAKKNIEDIFIMNRYDLVPNWLDNFTEANENNIESLFEINFKNGLTNGQETGMHRPKFFGLYLASGEGAWNDGSSRDWLLDEFDKELDKDGNTDMRKRYTLFYNDPNDTQLYYGKTYAEWDAINHFPHKCYWRKYTSVDTDNLPEDYSSGTNFRVLRLADVYLMYAEVLNEISTPDRTTAVEYINKVRRRVNMADLNAALFNDYETLKEQLRHERLVELCGECTRWNDLDRWGDLHDQTRVNQLAERDPDFLNYKVGINHLYIIPNHDISLYPGLTQNPGY